MNILFYSPFNNRSRDTESLMLAFHKQGHRVISLSQAAGEHIHEYLRARGVETFSHQIDRSSSFAYFLRHVWFLIRFCHKHEIDVVYSHLESANFVAVIAQYFVNAHVYIVRHHVDDAALRGYDKSVLYKATYRLARRVIVVSDQAVNYMVNVEKIRPGKILKINLAYDFSLYAKPDVNVVARMRNEFAAEVVLLTAGRLTKYKRPDLSIEVLKRLVDSGVSAKLILLGLGEDEDQLKQLAARYGLADRILMPGYVTNVIDFLASCDFLLHPSVSESSCVIVKEAAITNIPVIVCRNVGDFNEYIVHNQNAFLTNTDTFVDEATAIILNSRGNPVHLKFIANQLHLEVRKRFGIEHILEQYNELNK